MNVKVTDLPDAEPRPRRIAIGIFDGVHVGHREVIEGADTVLTFEPHPLSVIHPEAAPKLIMPFPVKRDVIEGLGVEELVVIPSTGSSPRSRRRSSRPDPGRALGAKQVSVGENFRFGAKAKGTPELLAAREEFETTRGPAGRGRQRDRLLDPDQALVAAGDVDGAALPRSPVHVRGRGRVRRQRGGARLSDREHRPRRPLVYPGHGVFAAFANGIRRPSTSASGRPSRPAAAC